ASHLLFLAEYGARRGSAEALAMAEHTLAMMWRGGIRDHLGGGLARYATDRRWLVPHFEKM
ncbi:MAG TPA: thioredoxin domain-containing protein, partial [Synergistaceae bacterium]|nr:thioredoxin domain-containing protein [Synergistaceae bacterium]